jgi:phycocyanobilin lyase beta subunit
MTQTITNSTEKLIEAVQKADSADGLLKAVENLAEVRSPQAIPTLIEVLGFNNPGAAVAAVDGLINIGEETVPYLLNSLDDYNYGARAWAIRVFAGIGDPRALDLLLNTATTDFSLSVRRAATKGLGIIKWDKLPPSEIDAAQLKVWETLCVICNDGEWVVRYATVVALEALAKTVKNLKFDLLNNIKNKLEEMLNNDVEIVVKARAKLALSELNN